MRSNIIIFFIFLVLKPFNFWAQFGPGGVGTTANNKLWLDANRGITLSSTSVTAWADQSGNGFIATPTTAISRPAFVASSANGYPTIDFDGTDDQFWINHNAAFNLTQWHIFVMPMTDLAKDYNAWLTKGDDGQENYEILSYSTNNIHTPIYFTDATRTAPNSGNSIVTSTLNIIEYSYSTAVGRDVYKNYGNIYTDNDNKTPSTNTNSLYIGNEKSTTGRNINGDLAEVIMYNAPLNSAQRIIVNNYLAAKYNCTLTTNDLFVQDNSSNGNFDHEMAGIGRVDGSNIHNDAKGSGIVRILNPSGLGDGEYYMWAHNNGPLGSYTTTPDVPAAQGIQARLLRVWRGSHVGTITSFDVQFDLTGLGPITNTDLRLLIDKNNNGVFSDETVAGGGIISGASFVSGSTYQFAAITGLTDNLRFTIGTINSTNTPLPIELNKLSADLKNNSVLLSWGTIKETNNSHFDIEKSIDGFNFTRITSITSKAIGGNSNSLINYNAIDNELNHPIYYYRLKQVDIDGDYKYSPSVSVKIHSRELKIYPNPNNGSFWIELPSSLLNQSVSVKIYDQLANEVANNVYNVNNDTNSTSSVKIEPSTTLTKGVYVCSITFNGTEYRLKLVVN